MSHHSHQHEEIHGVGYGILVLVWLGLVVLTGLTVVVSGVHIPSIAVLVALLIAATKSSLVINYFMHLKYESRIFKIILLMGIVTITIFIGLTFFDVLFRG